MRRRARPNNLENQNTMRRLQIPVRVSSPLNCSHYYVHHSIDLGPHLYSFKLGQCGGNEIVCKLLSRSKCVYSTSDYFNED